MYIILSHYRQCCLIAHRKLVHYLYQQWAAWLDHYSWIIVRIENRTTYDVDMHFGRRTTKIKQQTIYFWNVADLFEQILYLLFAQIDNSNDIYFAVLILYTTEMLIELRINKILNFVLWWTDGWFGILQSFKMNLKQKRSLLWVLRKFRKFRKILNKITCDLTKFKKF